MNSPTTTVVAGDRDALLALRGRLEAAGCRARVVPVDYASHTPHMQPLRERLLAALAPITPRSSEIPFVSAVTGTVLDTALLDAEYWFTNLRSPVRFDTATRTLIERGLRLFLECSPHPVLTTSISETLQDAAVTGHAAGTLRREHGGLDRFWHSASEAWAHGATITWQTHYPGARTVDLPTYPFQRQRHWLEAGTGADITGSGVDATGHPLLGAVVEVAGGDGVVLTGRVSLATHGWLADHAVRGVVLLPGTAMVELALSAGGRVGCWRVEELTLATPCVIPEDGAVQVQVVAGAADEAGRRTVNLYSRPDRGDAEWTRHATGTVAGGTGDVGSEATTADANPVASAGSGAGSGTGTGSGATGVDTAWAAQWPPPGAQPVDLTGAYPELAARGYEYGPLFQGVRRVWQAGTEVFAEVELPGTASAFAVHPALLDAALHPILLTATSAPPDTASSSAPSTAPSTGPSSGPGEVRLPFAWTGVGVHTLGATSLRVRLSIDGDTTSLSATDAAGTPVVTVESLLLRPTSTDALFAGDPTADGQLLRTEWVPVAAPGTPPHASVALVGPEYPRLPGAEAYPDLFALGDAVDALDAGPGAGADPGADAGTGLRTGTGADGPAPRFVVTSLVPLGALVHGQGRGDGVLDAVGELLDRTLCLAQAWLADDRFAESTLVAVTRNATGAGGVEPDLAAAPVWGLLRSAQTENPGRFVLIDLDGRHGNGDNGHGGHSGDSGDSGDCGDCGDCGDDGRDLATALAAAHAAGEPQVAVRGGAVLAPRLSRVEPPAPQGQPVLNRDGTVLITGGTGGLGATVARHLAAELGVRNLLLASRSGWEADGAVPLEAELAAFGAEVTVSACDVSDRRAVAELLAGIPADRPLTAVVHAAGVLDDATTAGMSAGQLARVLRPKVDAAWHLHELTRGHGLSAFVLFSSLAGVLGTAGQGNYAAANAFLDALAQHRHGLGLPALSVAWGMWELDTGMTAHLEGADLARLARSGVAPLPVRRGLALLDGALDRAAAGEPLVSAVRLNTASLRAMGGQGTLPPVFRALVPAKPRHAAAGATGAAGAAGAGTPALPWRGRLAELGDTERRQSLLALVRQHVAAVLAHPSPEAVDPERPLMELGFDSLTTVELRNRLGGATGLRLPVTLIYDHPTMHAVAAYLLAELVPAPLSPAQAVQAELDRLDGVLAGIAGDTDARALAASALKRLLSQLDGRPDGPGQDSDVLGRISSAASDDEIFALIDKGL